MICLYLFEVNGDQGETVAFLIHMTLMTSREECPQLQSFTYIVESLLLFIVYSFKALVPTPEGVLNQSNSI